MVSLFDPFWNFLLKWVILLTEGALFILNRVCNIAAKLNEEIATFLEKMEVTFLKLKDNGAMASK